LTKKHSWWKIHMQMIIMFLIGKRRQTNCIIFNKICCYFFFIFMALPPKYNNYPQPSPFLFIAMRFVMQSELYSNIFIWRNLCNQTFLCNINFTAYIYFAITQELTQSLLKNSAIIDDRRQGDAFNWLVLENVIHIFRLI
jgi:hypothetical protein